MKKILVLGAGLVGKPMALDLAKEKDFKIAVADISGDRLNKLNPDTFELIRVDLSDENILRQLVKSYDLILNALPGSLGYGASSAIIESGKNLVDISFFPEDPSNLVTLADKSNITAVIDCGVAPGMSYTLVGYVNHLLDRTDKVRIYVGGLPKIRILPWEYKAVFSPADVIEEYTRQARMKINNQIVSKEALTEEEIMPFDEIGNLEAFNTDGLRSLLRTIDCPDMVEKTLRYPGYVSKIKLLKDSGFFSTLQIPIDGIMISPLDLTCRILFPIWQLNAGDEDITIMQIVVEGLKDGQKLRYTFDLYDVFDIESGIHSMARTTGYTATIVVRMILSGLIKEKGLIFPEYLGRNKNYVDFLIQELRLRGINYVETIDVIT